MTTVTRTRTLPVLHLLISSGEKGLHVQTVHSMRPLELSDVRVEGVNLDTWSALELIQQIIEQEIGGTE